MKKEWQTPLMEVLDVNMTMLHTEGSALDNDFPDGTPTEDLTFS